MATGRVPTTANSPLTAKGDLFGYSTTQARVAVGTNGETLVADSSTSTGLRYQAPKTQNAVYNSGYDIWQRGTSFTANAGAIYTADRWMSWATTAGQSIYNNRQSAGNLSVTPNQSLQYCMRQGRTSGNTNTGAQRLFMTLESADSYRFAGKTVTFSFYARAGSGFTGIALTSFVTTGTGTDQIYYSFTGSSEQTQNNTLTTSWQRFTQTVTLATTTTEAAFGVYFLGVGTAGANDFFEITGVQFEIGSVATPYNSMTGTIQGELSACQRYYYRQSIAATPARFAIGMVNSTTIANFTTYLPVQMRTAPTALEQSGTAGDYSIVSSGTTITVCSAVPSVGSNSVNVVQYNFTVASGLVAGQAIEARPVNTSAYLGWSAEL